MPQTVVDLLNARKATRAISTEPLGEDAVAYLVEAARLAPSCFNKQPWRYLFVTSDDGLSKARACLAKTNAAWASRAPLLVIGYSRRDNDCAMKDGRAYHQFDLGLSVMNIMLAATERDLVARPMAGFSPKKVKEAFGLEDADEPLVMIAVGRQSDDESHLPEEKRGLGEKPRERKVASEIVKHV